MQRSRHSDELADLYADRYGTFLRVCIGVLGDEATAHDAVQEGFAHALKGIGTYSGRGTLEAWVWRVVLNAARDESRALRKRAAIGELDDSEPIAVLHDHADAGDDEIREWLRDLPEKQRLAVFLRYYADLDYRAIAVALEIEVGTVSATLSTAHASLRRALREVAS